MYSTRPVLGISLGDPRDERRPQPADAAERPEGDVAHEDVVLELLHAAARAQRLVRALVPLRERPARVRHPEELEVVVVRDVLVERFQDLVDALGHLDGVEVERRHALQRDCRDDAERTEPHARGVEDSGSLSGEQSTIEPSPAIRRRPTTCVGDAAEASAGAMRRGRDRAGDRLVGDVTEVLHRQSARVQLFIELRKRDPGLHGDGAFSRSYDSTSRVVVELDETAVRSAMAVKEWPAPTTLTR